MTRHNNTWLYPPKPRPKRNPLTSLWFIMFLLCLLILMAWVSLALPLYEPIAALDVCAPPC